MCSIYITKVKFTRISCWFLKYRIPKYRISQPFLAFGKIQILIYLIILVYVQVPSIIIFTTPSNGVVIYRFPEVWSYNLLAAS